MGSNLTFQEGHALIIVPQKMSLRKRAISAALAMAQRFQSDILFCSETLLCINAKSSTMALMALNALAGKPVELIVRGADALNALQVLSDLFSPTSESTRLTR